MRQEDLLPSALVESPDLAGSVRRTSPYRPSDGSPGRLQGCLTETHADSTRSGPTDQEWTEGGVWRTTMWDKDSVVSSLYTVDFALSTVEDKTRVSFVVDPV